MYPADRVFKVAGLCRWILLGLLLLSWGTPLGVAGPAVNPAAARAERAYVAARHRYAADTNDLTLVWQFARTTFDWAEFAPNDKVRAALAEEGIAASRRAVALSPRSASAHYYLGMNLGQLARTKSLGALKLVDEMERVFQVARELDEHFDFAGPDRNLGLLYLEAPSFSVGDKKKARIHLARAVELRPDSPENRLNYIDACLRWGNKHEAQTHMDALDKVWTTAQQTFSGDEWESSWVDWKARREKLKARLRASDSRR